MTKTNNTLLLLSGLLFVALITMLAYFIRLVPEDYLVIAAGKDNLMDYPKIMYATWDGRFPGMVLGDLVMRAVLNGVSPVFFYLLFLGMLFLGLFLIFNRMLDKLRLQANILTRCNLSLLFLTTLFYLTIGSQESWFWMLTSMFYGLVCLGVTALGIALLLSEKRNLFIYALLLFCFAFAGSESEPFALMLILFFALAVFYSILPRISFGHYILAKLPVTLKKNIPLTPKFYVAFIGCLLGFLSDYFAPGTHIRWQHMPHISFLLAIKRDIGAVAKFYLYYFPAKIPLILLFGLPCFFIGVYLRKTGIRLFNISFARFIIAVAILFTCILFFSFLPSCFVMGEAGPLRSWFHISIYMTIAAWIVFIYAGYQAKTSILSSSYLFNSALLLLVGFGLIVLIYQYRIVSVYSSKVDARMSYLKNLKSKNTSGIIYLEALPSSGMLYSAEVSRDTNDLTNTFLKQGLELHFTVSLK